MGSAAPTRSRLRGGLSPFWRRTPFALVRFPALLAALAGGALLLALTVSAYPLYLDAQSSEVLREEIAQPLITKYGAGIRYVRTALPLASTDGGSERVSRMTDAFATGVAPSDLLDAPIEEVLGPVVTVADPERPGSTRVARPFYGTDAVGHVEVIDGGEGSGVWIPQLIARTVRVGPGDDVVMQLGERRHEAEIAGVYRDLFTGPRRGYWLPMADQIWGERPDSAPLPQPILFERDAFFALSRTLRVETADLAIHAPLASPGTLNVSDAREVSRFLDGFRAQASDQSSAVGRELRCCYAFLGRFAADTQVSSSINVVLSTVAQRLVGIEGPTRLLEVVAALVSLAVIAAGGAFGAGARRAEARLLMARGRGVGTLALRSGLESLVPCLAGAAVGFILAVGLVAWTGPERAVGGSSLLAAGIAAAVAALVSVTVVAVASVAMSLTHSDYHRSRFGILARVPWELALVAFAVFAYDRVRDQLVGADLRSLGGVAPTLYLFLFPIAGIAGVSVLGARAFRAIARWIGDRRGGLRPPGYLAVHRLSDATGLALLLFAASTLAMGIFVQGRTVVGSLDRAVEQKADVFVGSDVQAWVGPDQKVPPDFPLPATRVVRVAEVGTIEPDGVRFDLLAIDPASFADAAAWSDTFSDVPLESLLARLEPGDGAAPVVVVGRESDVTQLEMTQRRVTTETVGHASAFPGMVSRRPMIVIDRSLLEREYEAATGPLDHPDARPEIWIKGEHAAATAAAYTLDNPPFSVFGGEDVENIPYIDAMIDMFAVLDGLGLAAAVLVVLALAMYLQARQRSQLVAYGLSRRMGMPRAGHRRALAVEVGSVLAASWVLGTALAIVVGVLLVPLLDPLPSVPPDPLVRPPALVVAAALAGIVAASWAAARLIEARARSTYLGEVLRVDE